MNFHQVPSAKERDALIGASLDAGINVFDHADIYGAGTSESLFGDVLAANPRWREKMIIQSKCGIRFPGDTYDDGPPARYDFRRKHIVRSVEGSLARLRIDRLDVLLLHRPDLLMESDEIGAAFDELSSSGKVRFFGVSNFHASQIEYLSKAMKRGLIVNQVELSLAHPNLIADGALFNTGQAGSSDAATFDYCRLHGIRMQAWSPLGGGRLLHPPHDAPANIHHTAAFVHELAERYDCDPAAIALAWLLRHPAGIQPVVGTTRLERLRPACVADTIELSREEWYELLERARGASVP
jgi:predicted oxidoreductase